MSRQASAEHQQALLVRLLQFEAARQHLGHLLKGQPRPCSIDRRGFCTSHTGQLKDVER